MADTDWAVALEALSDLRENTRNAHAAELAKIWGFDVDRIPVYSIEIFTEIVESATNVSMMLVSSIIESYGNSD